MKQSKQPSTKEKTRMLLTGIWKNHQSRFMDLVGELEELAVGLLLEMPGNDYWPEEYVIVDPNDVRDSISRISLVSLRRDPRILCYRPNGSTVPFDDLPLEDREMVVGKMIKALKEERDAKEA